MGRSLIPLVTGVVCSSSELAWERSSEVSKLLNYWGLGNLIGQLIRMIEPGNLIGHLNV